MRVLFITKGDSADYLSDMALHGLRSLLGPACIDVNRPWYMYEESFTGPYPRAKTECYGRGFTLFGLLPDDSLVDRTDVPAMIRARYFDFVVYGSITRSELYWDEVRAAYPRNRIALLDGEDGTELSPLRTQGIYFKRELASPDPDALPIQFAIPREKISTHIPDKTRLISPYEPWNLSYGHIYDTEAEYYSDYGQSFFARTRKKGGWDCMRHYEIMAAGAIPYFENLESCPELTMANLPKHTLIAARALADDWENAESADAQWGYFAAAIRSVLRLDLTTYALAERLVAEMTR